MLGNNMFVYCRNNPVYNFDSTGTISVRANPNTTYFEDILGGGGGGGAAILYPLVFFEDVISDTFDTWLNDQRKAVADIVSKSLARSSSRHSDNSMHEHHIVPQNDLRGLPAYIIVQEVFPDMGVNDPRNLIAVSARIHVRLHTNLYYILVNNTITIAY